MTGQTLDLVFMSGQRQDDLKVVNFVSSVHSRRLSQPGSNSCCRFFGLFGCVLKVVLPNVSPVSVADIFRGQHSVL